MMLARHDNVIQRVLSRSERLTISFIGDGVHVPYAALGNYLCAAGVEHVVLVTDGVAPGDTGDGRFSLGSQTVQADADGVLVRRPLASGRFYDHDAPHDGQVDPANGPRAKRGGTVDGPQSAAATREQGSGSREHGARSTEPDKRGPCFPPCTLCVAPRSVLPAPAPAPRFRPQHEAGARMLCRPGGGQAPPRGDRTTRPGQSHCGHRRVAVRGAFGLDGGRRHRLAARDRIPPRRIPGAARVAPGFFPAIP